MIHKSARPAEKVVAKEKLSLVVVVVGSECMVRLRERGNKIRIVFFLLGTIAGEMLSMKIIKQID